MTPAELFQQLLDLGVTLTPTAEGGVRVKAPAGVLTPELVAAMRECKPALTVLARPSQQGDFLPFPRFSCWMTGAQPSSTALFLRMPEPTVHDRPVQPKALRGRPCTVKGCTPLDTFTNGDPASLYYIPSGVCVSCYMRWKKTKRQGKHAQEKPRSKEK